MRVVAIALSVIVFSGSPFVAGAAADKLPRPPDLCDKGQFSVDDVRELLTGKATINHYSMSESTSGGGCAIGVVSVVGKGFAQVDISIREGDLQSYQNLIFFVPKPRTSMPEIGDEAFGTATKQANISNAKETDLFARRAGFNVLPNCIVLLVTEKSWLFRQRWRSGCQARGSVQEAACRPYVSAGAAVAVVSSDAARENYCQY